MEAVTRMSEADCNPMTERVLNVGTQKHTKVVCTDQPRYGNANHDYKIVRVVSGGSVLFDQRIKFQLGPIKEHGVNGIHNEDLLAIVIDRLQGFQAGDYRCRENAVALTKLEEAMMWLRKRTDDRAKRNVEGTSKL